MRDQGSCRTTSAPPDHTEQQRTNSLANNDRAREKAKSTRPKRDAGDRQPDTNPENRGSHGPPSTRRHPNLGPHGGDHAPHVEPHTSNEAPAGRNDHDGHGELLGTRPHEPRDSSASRPLDQ